MKVGDYVRTKNGNIRKIEEVINKDYNEPDYGVDKIVINIEEVEDTIYMEPFLYKEDIIKSSPNIIDLIEVGDIVNYGLLGGGMVIFKKDGGITTNTILFSNLKEKDIKKVITKEQIENIEYEVK